MKTKRMRTLKNTKMTKRAKKTLCCLLTGCMLAGMVPSAALAETGVPTTPETPTTTETTTAPETPTTPESPTAPEAPAAPSADGTPVGQSDADGDEYGISLLGDTENESVPYIERTWDSDYKKVEAVTQNVTNYTIVEDNNGDVTWSGGWYVVDSNVTINGTVTYTDKIHLILCDGAVLTVTGGIKDGKQEYGCDLNIYGQTNDTGKLTVTNENGEGIYAYYGLTVHGGVINATGSKNKNGYSYGIHQLMGGLTINGGSVTGHGCNGTERSYGIYAYSLYVNGGTIHGTHAETKGDSADIYGSRICIHGGTFTADVVGSIWRKAYDGIYGGTFEKNIMVPEDDYYVNVVTDLLGDGYVFQAAGGATPLRGMT